MRRIIATVNTSIDGYMEGPAGEGDLAWMMRFVEEGLADNAALLSDLDAILLGRQTHHGFSQFWPFQQGEFADLMNRPPKYVFAGEGSLSEAAWGDYYNAKLVERNVEQTVRELKAEDGKALVVLASGGLASSLLGLGLIDELQHVVVPVVFGSGKPYFRGVVGPVGLELSEVKPYPGGSVRLTYRRSGAE